MALETILKNICSFLEVLQNARSETVVKWDQQSVENAFKWAAYCEQIYNQSKGKSYYGDLDSEIKKIGKLPWMLGSIKVDLEMLQKSTELLIMALLQNSKRPKEVLNKLMLCSTFVKSRHLEEVLSELISVNILTQLVSDVGSSSPLKTKAPSLNGVSSDLMIEAQADLLNEHLTCLFANNNQLTNLMMEKLPQLTDSDIGLVIVANALLSTDPSPHVSVQKILLEQINICLEKDQKRAWTVLPIPIITELCCRNPSILDRYLSYLTSFGDDLKPHYHHGPVTSPCQLFTWKSGSEEHHLGTEDYDTLVSRFSHLINHGSPRVASSAEEIIQNSAKRSEFNVWRSLFNDVNRN